MFFQKRGKKQTYDPARQKPVLRVSICTGEKVAGFKDLQTGKFEDRMLVRTSRDLERFCASYGLSPQDVERDY